ncbi:MAG TPA: ABC transporter permease subunit [Thermoplasmata archaeon]|nr:ABC transporter permease subunit [Thermoplasmata archaeon]
MSISLPTYQRREAPLLGRSQRVRAIITTGLSRELRRPAALFTTAIGVLFTTATSMVLLFLAPILIPGQPIDLSFFYVTASNFTILLFVTLMASVIGSGLIADDRDSMALTLYLSRPITGADYLIAKASVLTPLVAFVSVLPLVIAPFVAFLLGLFPAEVALPAMGVGFAAGALLTAFYVSLSLSLSSMTRRKSYAAAGVFAVTFGLTIPAGVLASALNSPELLYLSPWEDFLAVARGVYGVSGGLIDWPGALAILLGATVLASLLAYLRMNAVEVVSG